MSRRDTYMQGVKPYFRQSDDMEAALHLALIARRYTQERATAHEVSEACRMWTHAIKGDL